MSGVSGYYRYMHGYGLTYHPGRLNRPPDIYGFTPILWIGYGLGYGEILWRNLGGYRSVLEVDML
ncbi:MAG: hypothetical protein QXQ29_06345 [Candidatus Bathyarchaeia archaeon]